MSTGIYSIGVSGIAAAQLNLLATEHNVVNASTPGYTRQRAVQATNIAVNTGAGSIGQGEGGGVLQGHAAARGDCAGSRGRSGVGRAG